MASRIGVFGWGIVAPKSPNIDVFRKNLASSESWLSPFNGFGPDNFLVGAPEFRFEEYQEWIDEHFAPRQFQKLKEKMDLPTLYAIGSFIQSLGQNPGLADELKFLGDQAHVYVGTGLGSLDTTYKASIQHYESQRVWNRFWGSPEHNPELRAFLSLPKSEQQARKDIPSAPASVDLRECAAAENEWFAYWTNQSSDLQQYLSELAEIDGTKIEGDVEAGKLNTIREKEKRRSKLQEKWQSSEPPWNVSANVIWNIHNTPAAQISILGRIKGLSFAPVAACSTFGVALRFAMKAIHSGEAKAVVVGATDPPPHALTVGSFYSGRVLSANREASVPLTHLQGTHVAGGAVIWIVGDFDYMTAKGFKPLGMEPLSVGVSSDAHHIITPSVDGPKAAIFQALSEAGATPNDIGTWDLHATATPGDYSEVATFSSIFSEPVVVTARKGTFGHGMSAGGGWELTAQYLGYEQGQLFPTPLAQAELNKPIGGLHQSFVFDSSCDAPQGLGGKLSMGIGGVNACIISKPLK